MIKTVIKKNGKKERFSLEKIKKSLNSALSSANLSSEKSEEIIEKVLNSLLEYFKNRKEVFSSEIDAKIILELENLSPEALILWRKYRKEKKS